MSHPKRVSRLVICLLALACAVVFWRWSDRSNTALTTQAHPIPSSLPAADFTGASNLNTPLVATTAAANTASAPQVTPPAPRFLGSAANARRNSSITVENRWPKAETLAETSTPDTADPTFRQRIRIVRTDFKYPLVRLEETLHLDLKSGTEALLAQIAMVADHVLVKIASSADVQTLATVVTANGGSIRSVKPASKTYLVTIPAPLDPDGLPDAIDTLKRQTGVIAIAEPDFIVHAIATPNDASFAQLYGLHNTGQTGGVVDADIDAPEAWNISTGSRTVRVGIIDTGIDYTHPDLAANMWTNPGEIAGNGIDDDNNGYVDDVRGWDFVNDDANPMDDHYHGTHCAGTIGGVGNNSTGVVGVNWQVSLVALKFLSASGSGSTSDAIEAVAYSTLIGLDLTSNSWGGGGYSQALFDAISSANTAGKLFIAAAGNNATNTDASINYPSGYNLPNIVTVAATDHSDQLAYFSNYGAASVDLGAPGDNILSTAPNSAYRTLSGTSMATPHVAGATALLKAYRPSLTASDIKSALLASVDATPALTGKTLSGGRLNVNSALLSLNNLLVSPNSGWSVSAAAGGPVPTDSAAYTLRNLSGSARAWTATVDVPWAQLNAASGTVPSNGSVTSTVSLVAASVQGLAAGTYSGNLRITDVGSGRVHVRPLTLTSTPPAILTFNLSSDPGWARTGQWAFGQPTGLGDGAYGNPDPTSGYTGTNVLGVNLAGNYSTTIGGPYTLTAGPFNFTGVTATRLQFRRWLNSDYEPYVSATVELSTNGTTWRTLWRNSSTLITESSWSLQDIDLSAYADNQSSVSIRWTYTVSSGAWPLSGWNLDDIVILGAPAKALSFDPVAPLSENAGSASATLRLNPAPSAPLTVNFLGGSPGTVSNPATIVVPAGATSATVPLSIIDNALLDGTRTVLITPSALGYSATPLTLTINDNETATLTLELPTGATEGSTGIGRVTSSAISQAPITVSLSSTLADAASVPATVIIPSGATSTEFTVTFPDNTRIEGARTASIAASVTGWIGATSTLTVADNDLRTLGLTLVSGLAEGQGTVADVGTITINGTLGTPLTVTLTSSAPGKLTAPSTVAIPAGATTVKFAVTLPDDAVLDGAQTVTVTASATTFTSAQAATTVADNDPASFAFDTIPSPQYSGQSFSARVSALDINGAPALGFNGVANLSGKIASAPASLQPAQTTAFTAGAWTGGVTALGAGDNWTVQAAYSSAVGTSNAFTVRVPLVQVVTLANNDIVYDAGTNRIYASTPSGTIIPINPTTGALDSAVTVATTATTLIARATDGSRLWVAHDGGKQVRQVTLPALAPGSGFTVAGGYAANGLAPLPDAAASLATLEGDSFFQRISVYDGLTPRSTNYSGYYLASTLAAGTGNRLYGINNYHSGNEFSRFSVATGGVALIDQYSGIAGYGSVVADQNMVVTTGGRVLQGDSKSILASLPYSGPVRPDTAAKRVYLLSDQGGGVRRLRSYDTDRFTEVGGSNVTGVSGTPDQLIRFGAGGLAFRTPTQVFLLNTTLVPTTDSADLQVTQLATPNPATTGQPLNYLVFVRNLGGGPAASVVLTDILPTNVTLVEAVASQGNVATSSGQVTASFGTLAAGAEATLRLQITPLAAGSTVNTVNVTAITGDPDTSNNKATSTVSVAAPAALAMRRAAISARDLAYDPVTDRLLVTVSNTATSLPNSLLRLSPASLAAYSGEYLGNNPGRLKLTANGQYAYAILDGSYGIARAPVSSGASLLQAFSVHQLNSPYGLQKALDIISPPNRPATVAARLKSVSSTGGHGVGLFENGVLLPTVMSGVYSSDSLAASDDGSLLFGLESNSFTRINVMSDGLTFKNEISNQPFGSTSFLKKAGGLLYTTNGRIFDPIAGTLIANLAVSGPVEPSLDDEAFYILDGTTLRSYDLVTRVPISTLALGTLDGTPTNLVRCGGRSLAFTTSTGQLYVVEAPTFVPAPALRVVLPSRLTEGSGTAPGVGRVDILRPTSADIPIQLTSSAPDVLDVTRNIILPAGQTSVTFDVTVTDNTGLNGTRSVTVTPSTTATYTPKSATTLVDDDESGVLSLTLPATLTEGASTVTGQATLTISAAASAPLTVALASSDTTELQVPATVTIPAGASSVSFALTVPDDDLMDGTQPATVTATVLNYTSGSATVQIADNEGRTLTLTLPATVNENAGYVYATLTLPGKTIAPLAVSLSSTDTTELTTPAAYTVAAGVSSASIYLTVVDDTLRDGAQNVTVAATSTGFTSGSATISVRDNEPASGTWSIIASPQTAGVAFTATLTLKTIDGFVAGGFSGYVPITATNSSGSAALQNSPVSLYCSNGVATASLTALTAGGNTRLRSQVSDLPLIDSNSFTVQNGALAQFAVSALNPQQFVGVPANVTITAQDAYGNTVTAFTGSAALSASPAPTVTGTGTNSTGLYPLYGYYTVGNRTQGVYTPTEIGAAGTLTGLALNLTALPGLSLQNWTLRLKHSATTTTTGWDAAGWTTVHKGTASFTTVTPGWITFPFTTPFIYDGTSNLMVDFSYQNSTNALSSSGIVKTTNTASSRLRYYNSSSSSYGDPLLWSGTTQPSSLANYVPNLRLTRSGVPISPTTSDSFTAGTWTGNVTFQAVSVSASAITLQALQGSAFGQSTAFTVLPSPILTLTPEDTFTVTGQRGDDFTTRSRTYTLTNITGTSIDWTADNSATWLSFSTSGGTLAPGASTTITVTLTAASSALPSGTQTADLVFKVAGIINATRRVELTTTPVGDLALTPASGFSPIGLSGGPFIPATASWTLSNPGDAPLTWTAAKSQSWISLSTTGGTLAPGASTTVAATLSASANTLPISVYTDTITFANTSTGRGNTTRAAILTVRAPVPPVITLPPPNTSVASMDNAVLKITSTSDGTPSYQWYRGNSGDISSPVSGATGPLLVTPPLTTTTSFWVRITNYVGATDSATVTVAVLPKASLNLMAMGANIYGKPDGSLSNKNTLPVLIASNVTQMTDGESYSLFVKSDGTLWASGYNYFGQLGDGTTTSRSTAVQVATNVAVAMAGADHTLFIKTDRTLWGMGADSYGQFGNGTTSYNHPSPYQIAADVVQASAGNTFTLFLKSNGTLWAMGDNSVGQLGDGTTTMRTAPVQLASGVAQISAGYNHTLFIKTDGTLWGTGNNFAGQLGDGTTINRLTPIQITTNVIQACAGEYHTRFIKADGTSWAVGSNNLGKIGDGTSSNRYSPVQITTDSLQTYAGNTHSLILKNGGTLWAVGNNAWGQFGNGTTSYYNYLPLQIASGVANASAGNTQSSFLSKVPIVVTQPLSQPVVEGQTATLSVTVCGASNLVYQWYLGGSGTTAVPIVGPTTATFTTPPLTATTSYWVRITNSSGSTDSQTATVTVQLPPDSDSDGLPDAWETAHGLDPASSTTANGRLGDPDGDGIPNLLEYAFGLDPQHAESASPYSVQTGVAPDTAQLELRFTYRRLIYPGTLTYIVATSPDLTTWSSTSRVVQRSVTSNNDGTETVVTGIPLNSGRTFVRIQVTTP